MSNIRMENGDPEYRPKPSDFHPFEGYQSEFVKDFFALSLVTFAYTNFKKARRIKNFEELKNFIQSGDYTNRKLHNEFFKTYPQLAFDSLLDYILISIAFENYFKAKLLLNNFVIHNVKKETNAVLCKKQKRQPIEVSDLIFKDKSTCKDLKETTLNYSLLLNTDMYSKYYNISSKNLEYLKKLNKHRNSLHLHMSIKFDLSKAELNNLAELKRIVEIDFALLSRHLSEKLGGTNKTKLPLP